MIVYLPEWIVFGCSTSVRFLVRERVYRFPLPILGFQVLDCPAVVATHLPAFVDWGTEPRDCPSDPTLTSEGSRIAGNR